MYTRSTRCPCTLQRGSGCRPLDASPSLLPRWSVVELRVRMLELHESHGMEHDRGHVVLARLVVVVLACPDTLGVAHERRERAGPGVASLPVALLILLGALAVDPGHPPERDHRAPAACRLL